MTEVIHNRKIEDEMKDAYLAYSMSVIVGRALPDVRDGLKPVHRRILFAMAEMGMFYNKSFKKCARMVGEVLGKFHPHGDTAVYDSLVRLAQEFSLRYPLIKGQGNFGSIDGDSAAAMRYTEAKLSKISSEMLADIKKETVDFADNFDGSIKEPLVLPSKLPNLLINGSTGIAVGMATNIPPHNLNEINNAVLHLIDNPECEPEDLLPFVQGPDFPTGGIICGRAGIRAAYKLGRGKVRVKAKTNIEEKKGREAIIVTEIPYMVNKSNLIESMANLVRDKRVEGIHDIRDESDRKGMRIVIEIKKGHDPNIVNNQLFKYTQMRTTFGIINLALVNNQPRILNLKQILNNFIEHRKEVITRRTRYDLKKAQERAHILEGLLIALADIDEIVKGIKASNSVDEAKSFLTNSYSLSSDQVQAILDMKLQKLTSLETEKINKEFEQLQEIIKELNSILESDEKVKNIIKEETNEMTDKYGDERKTSIEESDDEIDIEDLIPEEDVVITTTSSGYVKRVPLTEYKAQRRGGTGIIGTGKKEEDVVDDLFVTNTHNYILCFSNKGTVYWLKAYRIPEAGRYSKGKNIVNLLRMEKGEKITTFIPIKEFNETQNLVMATKNGLVKKTALKDYSRPRKGGIIGIKLKEDDDLIAVRLTEGWNKVIIASENGNAIRFDEKNVRNTGRSSMGVKGITLKGNDKVIGMELEEKEATLLTVTEHGYGKRTEISEYRLIGRGGKGVINIKTSERNGKVVAIKSVKEDEEILLISQLGKIIRIPVKDISKIGRNTQGVRVMRLGDDDRVSMTAKIKNEIEEAEEENEPNNE
jgi:DNA gyrase subunit A